MNVLSLFDGMSCGRIALERAGMPVTNYYASEIDKYAIKVSEANYPDIIRLGDVTKVKIDKGRKIDLLIAGSPCQGFSFAGKQLNFEDPRSALFFEFVRLLKECRRYNPDVLFMLENVKMKKEYQDVISRLLGVEPIEINSALVSAQNRKRLYWTNILNVEQPEDRGILLKDILEDIAFDKESKAFNTNPSGNGMNFTIHSIESKSPCLTTNKGEGSKIGYGAGRIVGRKINPSTGKRDDCNTEIPTVQRFEFNSDIEKTNCLTTVEKDNILKPIIVGRINSSQDGKICHPNGKSFCHTAGNNNQPKVAIFDINQYNGRSKENILKNSKTINEKAVSMCGNANVSGSGVNVIDFQDKIHYRKLTPIECERLQNVPDNYTASVSNSQRYKMLGNGWNVNTIQHIFSHIKL